uniref:Uncharacterized protein n=1 Tax=Panagrolaimus sp. PS1159 TaxID=55785 RepID=A0AC35EYZ6_9BILA
MNAIECISFHDFKESGKPRKINLGFCGASTGYCVRAVYSDPNSSHKNGYSLGCDKTDCQNVGNPDYGWDESGCKANTDFGRDGHICCCKDKDHCNGINTTKTWYYKMLFLSFVICVIYQLL